MAWIKALILRAALYVLGSLALVLGSFFLLQLLFPDLRQPRDIPDSVLFQEIAREDQSGPGRKRLRVVIVSTAPMAANLDAIHASLLRQASKRLHAASDADAIKVVLVMSKELASAPPLGELTLAPDGKGWDGQQDWKQELSQPEPKFPKEAEEILMVAKTYLDRTAKAERSGSALVAQIQAQWPELESTAIRQVLRPQYKHVHTKPEQP